VPLLVDPKVPHLDFYRGATLVTPNHHEAEAHGRACASARRRCARGGARFLRSAPGARAC
jgi:bifunctional ADP-heptose synthase (sugar kinase/adenylyltransferase)